MKRTLQGKEILILSDDDQNDSESVQLRPKLMGKNKFQTQNLDNDINQNPRKMKKQESFLNESNVKNFSTFENDKQYFDAPLDCSTVQNYSQFSESRCISQKQNFTVNLDQEQVQPKNKEKQKDEEKKIQKVLKNPQSYYMPLQINRTAKKYDNLTWKWIGNKKQLWVSRFKGTKCHFIPAFLDFTIPSQGKHILRMEITRSQDYKIYFGITTKKAVYLQWTNIIPQPFIAFSFQRCCIIEKSYKQNTTMKQIIPNFTKVYNNIQMQVDMQNFLITFSLKKNKKYKVYHEIPQQFIREAQISDKQENVKKKLYGLVPFVGMQTDYDQFKFLSEQ